MISVHDFIYVLAEGNKRLVAHIEDLYEDVRANNMVSVRWFHKVNEVNIVLPPDTNDREIFFSLCLQDFSVECIDGLAAVLGFEDFDKFHQEPQLRSSSWDPFLCRRRIDIDNVEPFDITQVQGYWSQDLLRFMYPSCLKLRLKIKGHGSSIISSEIQGNCKRKRQPNTGPVHDIEKSKGLSVGNRLGTPDQAKNSPITIFRRRLVKQVRSQQQNLIAPGLGIELLSQDSGIRGCWFHCMVLKERKDKIKVQYRDVEDADGTGNLQEWVSTSRIAAPDKLGIRMCGRPIVRPVPPKKDVGLCSFEVGKIVDAWRYDGWWEGIVIRTDSEGKIHVYFPGEQQASIFRPADLRASQDWAGNKWNCIKSRPDIATLLLSELDHDKFSDCITFQNLPSGIQTEAEPRQEGGDCSPPSSGHAEKHRSELARSFIHEDLKWSSSRKRTLGRQIEKKKALSSKKLRIDISHKSGRQPKAEDVGNSSPFLIPNSLKVVDPENCKSGGDSLFGAPMSLCSNLVMT